MLQPGIEDVVFVTLRFASGKLAHLHLSWLHPRKERRLTLVCSQKMVEFDDVAPEKLRIYDKGYDRPPEFTQFARVPDDPRRRRPHPATADGGAAARRAAPLPRLHRTGARPASDLASGVRVTAVLEAAERSLARAGCRYPLKPGRFGLRTCYLRMNVSAPWRLRNAVDSADVETGESERGPSVDFRRYLLALRQYIWLIGALVVLAVAGAVIYTNRVTPIYEATASVQIEPKLPDLLGTGDMFNGAGANTTEYYKQQKPRDR